MRDLVFGRATKPKSAAMRDDLKVQHDDARRMVTPERLQLDDRHDPFVLLWGIVQQTTAS
jgi:hypothetical protein